MLKSIRYFAFVGLGLALLTGQPAAADNLTVFAAASLKNALDDIAAKWKDNGAGTVGASYASSSTLAKQIEQGAPADVFISADTQWMDYVNKKSLVETPHDLLGNRLVLISAKDNPLTLEIKGAEAGRGAGRRAARGRRPIERAGRHLCQGGADQAQNLGFGPAQAGARRRRSCGAHPGVARRGSARHRL
jgi:ABC-type molybdate transport system substrate-binding protein